MALSACFQPWATRAPICSWTESPGLPQSSIHSWPWTASGNSVVTAGTPFCPPCRSPAAFSPSRTPHSLEACSWAPRIVLPGVSPRTLLRSPGGQQGSPRPTKSFSPEWRPVQVLMGAHGRGDTCVAAQRGLRAGALGAQGQAGAAQGAAPAGRSWSPRRAVREAGRRPSAGGRAGKAEPSGPSPAGGQRGSFSDRPPRRPCPPRRRARPPRGPPG